MSPGSNKLDRRPTSVLVAGFDLEDKEEIMKHFTKFGEIADSVEDEVGSPLLSLFPNYISYFAVDSLHHFEI